MGRVVRVPTIYKAILPLLILAVFGNSAVAWAEKIRVVTYNVQFLPEPASSKNERPQPEYRAKRIAEEVSQFDIVGLQETFHETYRKQIIRQVNQQQKGIFHAVASPTPNGFFTSGGCLILSRWLVSDSSSMVYANFSKPTDYGLRADGFAAKGVIHARLASGNDPSSKQMDVFVTHLEARADELRPLQYGEMVAFIKSVSAEDRPAIILGDMNTRGSAPYREDVDSQYSSLASKLSEVRPQGELVDVWVALKGEALGGTTDQESDEIGKRIDYIFVINPAKEHARLKPVSVEVRTYQDSEVTALSDHNAVVAELEWVLP